MPSQQQRSDQLISEYLSKAEPTIHSRGTPSQHQSPDLFIEAKLSKMNSFMQGMELLHLIGH